MRQDEEFSPLRIVKKNVTDFDRCAYRVYKGPMEFVTVEAATALEAFRESGIQDPLRIVRETRFMERLLDQHRFTELEELIETGVIMEAPMAITGHREAVPQAVQRGEEADAAMSAPPQGDGTSPVMDGDRTEAEDAPTEENAEESQLSESDIQALLGEEEQQRAREATAGEDGLSPDDVAQLLRHDAKKE